MTIEGAANVPGMIFLQSRHTPDGSRELLYASPGVRDLYGIEPEALLANSCALIEAAHADDRECLRRSMLAAQEVLGPWRFEHRIVRPDGSVVWVQGNAVPRLAEDGSTLWNGYVSDVTAAKQSEQRISFLAFHDALTGLENRLGGDELVLVPVLVLVLEMELRDALCRAAIALSLALGLEVVAEGVEGIGPTRVCPRSESKQRQNRRELPHFDNDLERSTPSCTPTALGVLCAYRPVD